MKVGEIGINFSTVEHVDYFSSETLLEYDLLFLDLIYVGNMAIDETIRSIEIGKQKVRDYYDFRKTPIIIVMPTEFRVKINNKTHQPEDFIYDSYTFTDESVVQVDIISQTKFTEFFKKYSNIFFYRSYLYRYPLGTQPLIKTRHSNRIVSCYNENFIFLPKFNLPTELEEEFFKDLYNVIASLKKTSTDTFTPPEWLNGYYLPYEKPLATQIEEIKASIARQQQELGSKNEALKAVRAKKSLLVGSGDALEADIAEIFRELGFELLAVEPGRDDLIVKYDNRVAVVEIKGVSGSAAEKHAAQLEKWVMNYMEENAQPKGILIVNAFKDRELTAREETFPNQMLAFSTRREHCLLSTIQLLGIYYEIKSSPARKEELINSLFETVGIYPQFQDWTKFIEQ